MFPDLRAQLTSLKCLSPINLNELKTVENYLKGRQQLNLIAPKIYHYVINSCGEEVAPKEAIGFWSKLRRMSFDLYQKYWDRVEETDSVDSKPMILIERDQHGVMCTHCTIESWEEDKPIKSYVGLINKSTGREHGIVRCATPMYIEEATFKDG